MNKSAQLQHKTVSLIAVLKSVIIAGAQVHHSTWSGRVSH